MYRTFLISHQAFSLQKIVLPALFSGHYYFIFLSLYSFYSTLHVLIRTGLEGKTISILVKMIKKEEDRNLPPQLSKMKMNENSDLYQSM